MSVNKVQHGQMRYNGETEQQIILAAEKLYNAGQYKKAIERISPVYYAALRAGRVSKLPTRVLRLFFPMPLEYLKHVVNDLPENIRKQPPEKIAEFMLLQFSMMRQESVLDPFAHNRSSGARGLGQIRPSTANWFAWIRFKIRSFNLYRPADNIKIMAGYLDYLLKKRHGNRDLAVASYNAGPNKIGRYIEHHNWNLPASHVIKHNKEAGEYIEIVKRNFGNYSRLYSQNLLLTAKELSTYKPDPRLQAKIKPKGRIAAKAVAQNKTKPAGAKSSAMHYVQLGYFMNYGYAQQLKKDLNIQNVHIQPKVVGNKAHYIVRAAFATLKEAKVFLARAKSKHPDAFIAS